MGFLGFGGKKEDKEKQQEQQQKQEQQSVPDPVIDEIPKQIPVKTELQEIEKKQQEKEVKQQELLKQEENFQIQPVQESEPQTQVVIADYINMLKFWKNPDYIRAKQLLIDDYFLPGIQLYEEMPYRMTDIKRDYILTTFQSQTQRTIALGLSTILITMISYRSNRRIKTTFRNTILGYFGVGLFICPEVYNPFMIKNSQ
ncbi:hypothetical protein PPERSA_00237 [Pseudocohnilembus persalinus]|uniref:Uncharacterized protein n=1 Tax=Pseudocohnilembus persalinus TaxID=266149 RepID=A0A0V0Q8U1_PSEPJ|nr:hypothetical protein PPERSA_00237 [Pseudocohnilembus persalinus]|eukprot:KRW98649.1 hypothetical protein PPERSA_00237 [Pseudocohnilembus persalinus]